MPTAEPTIAQFMTETPATADEGLLLTDARERMFLDHIRHLVVLKGGHLSGVLSSRDIALTLALRGVDAKTVTVAEAMTRCPYAVAPTTPISVAAREMEAHGYGSALVVVGDEVVGVFTTTDALRALRQLATGVRAEPLAPAEHLPPTEQGDERPLRLPRHRPLDMSPPRMFSTTSA